ncbi:MAG: response regulator [Bacteroidota bacterium]
MAAKILVVDDEPQFERLILQRFRKRIRAGEYAFSFAQNGQEALDKVAAEGPFDMVLSDINMPVMDGLTLIARLKEAYPLLKTVIVSAYGDMKNIRTAMSRGAFDFVTKPIEFTDLQATMEKTLEEAAMIKEAAQARELAASNERLQALDRLKTQFFTNISHEFRTPLTVISGMAEQIELYPDRWLGKGLNMIKRNTGSLLDLVNQILDLRKLETGNMSLKLIQADVIAYLNYLCETFQYFAETRDIKLHFIANPTTLEMDFDQEKLLRIFSNLVDNAIKYTPEGGNVYVLVDRVENQLQLKVRDTGHGIAAEQVEQVFNRFFTSADADGSEQKGTGIGLSLVHELVKLLEGSIEVGSIVGEGTTFKVLLPIRNTAPKQLIDQELSNKGPQLNESSLTLPTITAGDTELPRVLVVEDNPDVAQYILACLEGHYQLDRAADGQEGIEKALEEIPDLIVSDVMMPRKDGLELCQTLKADERTSHIPIVLLTAKADIESRLAGLEKGADAYLAKPFDRKELLVRLEKLIELRERMQARYSSGAFSEAEEAPPEDPFVVKLKAAINENIDDENFGVLELCSALALSRTQLHRKVKALTGRSTSNFVRIIRLAKAKELLRTSDLNISQVAYEVGFRDPKYFSRTFAQEYGESPNQFRK